MALINCPNCNKEISDKAKVCVGCGHRLVNDETSSISIYRGEDAKEDLADALLEELEELYPDLDVNMYYGGQPLYYYISAE